MRKQIYIFIIFIIGFGNAIADTIIAPPFDNFTLGLNAGVFFPIYQSNYDFFEDIDYGTNPFILPTVGYKVGLISIFGVNSGISYKLGFNYSSFFYTNRSINRKSINSNIFKEVIKVYENYIEIPIEIRKIIINNVFQLDSKPTINSLGISFGINCGYRTVNRIEYTPYYFASEGTSASYTNTLNKYKLDLKLGVDIAQPDYLISLNYNFPIFQNLTEENNMVSFKNKRAYIKFHSVNVDFTYFIFNVDKGKLKFFFD